MKNLKLLILSIFTVFLFVGCTVLPALLGAVFEPVSEKGWAKKSALNRLMNHPEKQLLTKSEKLKAAKAICELKHLDKKKDNRVYTDAAKIFCKLEENDKIYFFDKCMECGNLIDTIATSYLLVRDGKPIEQAVIEQKLNDELKIERLH